jgi:hypothetical protein
VSAVRFSALCQSCGKQGTTVFGEHGKPAWCACSGRKLGGPYVAAPGFVVAFIYESADAAAFRERCRLAGNAFIAAKDARSSRWVRCGRGWRELPRGYAKRERLERAYTNALRALRKLQRQCPHERASIFDPCMCDCCHGEMPGIEWAVQSAVTA